MGSCVNFLKFMRIKLIRRRRVADRVAAVDLIWEDDGDASSIACKQKSKGMANLFSWEEIQRLTMNFSLAIGYGGFSTVYLARFPDSSLAAVKIQCSSERLDLAYEQELQILLHLHHPHIVKLIGHCNNAEGGILVMEYLPNGNLQEALHGSNSWSTVLPWRKRMAIAFQIAQAMEYLHEKCSLQIVHGDIKSSNVLLDENFNCKLCDFGSAHMGFSSIVAPPSSRSRAMMVGSPGYTDPHYLRTGLASKKNDVYSFGVIVLELLTGMEAMDPSTGERLTARAKPMLQKAIVEIIDPHVRQEVKLEEAEIMAALAAACLADSPVLRPCASEILATMRNGIPSLGLAEKKLNQYA